MASKQLFRPTLGWWISSMFDIFFAIPDGSLISGTLSLPPESSFNDKRIVRNGGIRFSRHSPFPMIVSHSESQADKDRDIGLLLPPSDGYVPGFEEWDQYGSDSAYSLHWSKIHLHDRYKNGYCGIIEACLYAKGNPDDGEILARANLDLPSKRSSEKPTLTLIIYTHPGYLVFDAFLWTCRRLGWEQSVEQLAQPTA